MNPDLICKCAHRASLHVHGDDGKGCKPSCNCGEFRLAVRPVQDETAATGTEDVA